MNYASTLNFSQNQLLGWLRVHDSVCSPRFFAVDVRSHTFFFFFSFGYIAGSIVTLAMALPQGNIQHVHMENLILYVGWRVCLFSSPAISGLMNLIHHGALEARESCSTRRHDHRVVIEIWCVQLLTAALFLPSEQLKKNRQWPLFPEEVSAFSPWFLCDNQSCCFWNCVVASFQLLNPVEIKLLLILPCKPEYLY